ncbi:MAG: ribonuclease Z [Methanomassiliicoccales archaeon]|nr:MAG: ribonuclease Z [Methanomassiliicoccales archaeon]
MKITFLGTNGWYDTATGNTVCTLLSTKERYIVLDAGNGIWKLDRYMTSVRPVDLFLSHFHLDHTIGLHTLVKFSFIPEMRIFGQIGTSQALNTLVNLPFTVPLDQLPYRVEVRDLEEGEHEIGYKVTCLPLVHASPCYGYRYEIDGKVIAYTTDTGPCDNIERLARDADVLIAECAFRKGETSAKWPHLNPETAIDIAIRSGCRKLILTHFDAHRWPDLRERQSIKDLVKDFNGLIVAFDDEQVEI